jgi:hypothetical protein
MAQDTAAQTSGGATRKSWHGEVEAIDAHHRETELALLLDRIRSGGCK